MDSQPKLHILLTRQEIEATVRRLADEITRDYHDKLPLLVGILKGSFMFMADLVRLLDFPLEVEFIRLSSYGKGSQTSGEVKVVQGLRSSIKNREVLVVAAGGEVLASLGLPIAGLLSDKPLEIVVGKLEKLERLAKGLGTTLSSPFATLSFLALPVIPELRLTDLGLVDVNEFKIIDHNGGE